MNSILFVCTGNTCRSSMAEAIFKNIIKDDKCLRDLKVISAGTSVYLEEAATFEAIKALELMNIDLTCHRSKQLTEKLIIDADLILTMTYSHKMRVINIYPKAEIKAFTLKEYINENSKEDILDPYGMSLEYYIDCSKDIYNELVKLKEKLKKGCTDDSNRL